MRVPEGRPDGLKLQRRAVEGLTFPRREPLALLYCVGVVHDGPHQRIIPWLVSAFVLQSRLLALMRRLGADHEPIPVVDGVALEEVLVPAPKRASRQGNRACSMTRISGTYSEMIHSSSSCSLSHVKIT